MATFVTLGFFKTPYWLVGSILLLIYFVFVYMVYFEEKLKKATIGRSNPGSAATSNYYDEYKSQSEKKTMLSDEVSSPTKTVKYEENENFEDYD